MLAINQNFQAWITFRGDRSTPGRHFPASCPAHSPHPELQKITILLCLLKQFP